MPGYRVPGTRYNTIWQVTQRENRENRNLSQESQKRLPTMTSWRKVLLQRLSMMRNVTENRMPWARSLSSLRLTKSMPNFSTNREPIGFLSKRFLDRPTNDSDGGAKLPPSFAHDLLSNFPFPGVNAARSSAHRRKKGGSKGGQGEEEETYRVVAHCFSVLGEAFRFQEAVGTASCWECVSLLDTLE